MCSTFTAANAARRDDPVPVAAILAAYDRATHAEDVTTIETAGTIEGEGLTGDFHSWRSGENERDDQRLGPRIETTLRLGDRIYVRNASGNVRELKGYLRRRAITSEFVDSGEFLKHPDRSRFVGYGNVAGRRAWRIEVNAPGGEPETLWIDSASGLPLRLEYLDGDGPTTVDFSDWREIGGRKYPFRSVTSDGERDYDIVEQTTSVVVDRPIAPETFAPLVARVLAAEGAQTVPLLDRGQHVACTVTIAGKPFAFLIDSGAQNVLLDSAIAKTLALPELGSLEVRGATRSGGLHVLKLPRLDIAGAHLDDLVASSIDLQGSTRGAVRLDGILGYPFFAASLVELDFARHTMRFGPPGSFAPRGRKIALDLDRGIPEAIFRVNGHMDASFIVDTGNGGEMLLYRPFIDAHPGVVPFSSRGSVNFGLGGAAATYRTQLDEIEVGDAHLYRRAVDVVLAKKGAFADRVDAGNVGLGVLRNFVVTFDLGHDALYLERGASFDDGRSRPATPS